jgi:glutathione-independent formaldehyde dehydrogenase
MKAVIYKDVNEMAVKEIKKPKIEEPTDIILRITSSGICGSDLHVYDGRTPMKSGQSLGHEIMGIVDEVGDAVVSLKAGDRVVLPFNQSCGFCHNCTRGYTSACLTTNPDGVGGGYGYPGMGPYQGGQAQYIRVRFGDFNALKLPGEEGDEFEDDFLLLSDIFPTGYHATELAMVKPGSTVAVFGAGSVGLLSAYSAILKGASQVFVVDCVEERLNRAESIGAIPINYKEGDPVEAIKKYRKENRLTTESLKPGEEKMDGVMCGIDAVGYQSRSRENPDKEDSTQVLRDLAELVNPTGAIGLIGVYSKTDLGGKDEDAKKGILPVPIGPFWQKGITVGMGQCPVRKYDHELRDLIIAGKAKPSFIVSHRVAIDEAPEMYAKFDLRGTGEGEPYTKIILKPSEK